MSEHHSAYDAERYCETKDVTYSHRVEDVGSYNWCIVPGGGADAILFASIAVACACLAQPRWSALILLLSGAGYESFAYYVNLKQASNGVALWLGIRPADIFIFIFLPPLLLDSAVRIDFYLLRKVGANIIFLAFILVAFSTFLFIPILLYAPGLRLIDEGWNANYAAMFGTMIASTDAASVVLILKSGGAPEILSVILEGEALFNDASSLTMFEIFEELVVQNEHRSLGMEIGEIIRETIKSAAIGSGVGIALGILTWWLLRWLQHRNMQPAVEVSLTVVMAYLSFYITQVFCHASGVLAVVVFGLFGSATLLWGMSNKAVQEDIYMKFWDVLIFIVNGIIFFYVGAAATNFTIRSSETLYVNGEPIPRNVVGKIFSTMFRKLPLVYLISFAMRGVLSYLSFHVLSLLKIGVRLGWRETVFVMVAGLRGSLSLILVSTVVTLAAEGGNVTENDVYVRAEIALWVTFYVIFTLVINASLLGPLLTILGLASVSAEQMHVRRQVKRTFLRFTEAALEDMQRDDDDMVQGVNWKAVAECADHTRSLNKVLPDTERKIQGVWQFLDALVYNDPVPEARDEPALGRDSAPALAGDSVTPHLQMARDSGAPAADSTLPQGKGRGSRGLGLKSSSGTSASPSSMSTLSRLRQATSTMFANATQVLHFRKHPAPNSLELGRASGAGATPTAGSVAANSYRQSPRAISFDLGQRERDVPPSTLGNSPRSSTKDVQRGARFGSPGPVAEGAHIPQVHVDDGGPCQLPTPDTLRLNSAHARDMAAAAAAAATGVPEKDFLLPPHRSRADGADCSACGGMLYSGADAGAGSSRAAGELDGTRLASRADGGRSPAQAVPPQRGAMASATPRPPISAELQASMQKLADEQDESLGQYLHTHEGGEQERFTFDQERATARSRRSSSASVSRLSASTRHTPGPSPHATPAVTPQSSATAQHAARTGAPPPSSTAGSPPEAAATQEAAFVLADSASALWRGGRQPSQLPVAGPPVPAHPAHLASSDGSTVHSPLAVTPPVRAEAAAATLSTVIDPVLAAKQHKQRQQHPAPVAASAFGSEAAQAVADGTTPSNPLLTSPSDTPSTAKSTGDRWRSAAARAASLCRAPSRAWQVDSMVCISLTGNSGATPDFGTGEDVPDPSEAARQKAAELQSLSLARQSVGHARSLGSKSMELHGASLHRRSTEPARPLALSFEPANKHGAALARASGGHPPLARTSADQHNPPLGRVSADPSHPSPSRKEQDSACLMSLARKSLDSLSETFGLKPQEFVGGGPVARTYNAKNRWDSEHPQRDGREDWKQDSIEEAAMAAAASAAVPELHAMGALGIADNTAGGGGWALARGQGPRPCHGSFVHSLEGEHADAALAVSSLQRSLPAGAAHGRPEAAAHVDDILESGAGGDNLLVVGAPAGHYSVRVLQAQRDAQQPGGGQRFYKHVMKSTPTGNPELRPIATSSMPSLARRTRTRERTLGTASIHRAFQEAQDRSEEPSSLDASSMPAVPSFKEARLDPAPSGRGLIKSSVQRFKSRLMKADDAQDGARRADVAQVIPEYRLRLLAGLKQVFRSKYAEGVISGSSYRILNFITSKGLHDPESELSLWPDAEAEVSSHLYLTVAARYHHGMRIAMNRLRHSRHWFVRMWAKPLELPSWVLATYLNRMMTVGLEVALELWLVLAHSPQVHWLEFGGPAGCSLLEEVKRDADAAWAFIIDRRIEAPERFQAIQTYRATVALLHQQQAFVQEMMEGGMIDDSEADRLHEVIHKRQQRVERRGASWKQPTLTQILRNTVFLRNQGPEIATWLRSSATFKVHKKGEVVWERDAGGGTAPGVFIVISGLVRCEVSLPSDDHPEGLCFYIGSGGVGGLLAAVVQEDLQGIGMRAVYAEGNALGKGPVVMHLPAELITRVGELATKYHVPAFQSLQLAIMRNVGTYILDLMKPAVIAQLVQHLTTILVQALDTSMGDRRLPAVKTLLKTEDTTALECMHELLQLTPHQLAALLAGMGPDHLVLQEATLKAITARAVTVLDAMKSAVPSASLVHVAPGQLFRQSATAILLQGALRPLPPGSSARRGMRADGSFTGPATAGSSSRLHRQPATVVQSSVCHRAPALLLWTADYFDNPMQHHHQPASLLLVASSKGATVLVLGLADEAEEEEEPQADSSPSFAAAQPSHQPGGRAEGPDLRRACGVPEEGLAQSSAGRRDSGLGRNSNSSMGHRSIGFGKAPFGGASWALFGPKANR